MSSGAGIDAATFEQLKATLYKANGGARAIVKTKKRTVRRGGLPGEDGVETTPIEYSEDDVCPMITPGPFTEFLNTKNIDLDTVSQDVILSLYDAFLTSLQVDAMAGGKKKQMQRGGGWPSRKEVQDFLKGVAIKSGRCLAGWLSTESYRSKIIAAKGAAATAAALVGYATPATATTIKTAAETAAAAWLTEVNTNAAASINAEEYLASPTFNSELTRHIAVMNLEQLKELVEKLHGLLQQIPAAAGGGARRRTTKHRGGALDMSKLYNVQGLIGTSKDPLQAAASIGTDNTPFPFSAGSSAGISYTSGINQDFINQLTPTLGQMGGARKRVADGRRRKAQRGGEEPLSQAQATKLIGDFLTYYNEISGGANFAAYLEETFMIILEPIYRMVINLYKPLNEEKLSAATLENIGESTRLPLINPNIISELTNKYTELKPKQFVFPLNDRMTIHFANSELLYNKKSTVDIGLIEVLLQAILQLLNPNEIQQIITNYFNMLAPSRNHNVVWMNDLNTLCTNLDRKCLLLYQLAVLLLQHISDLIENKTYISRYNIKDMSSSLGITMTLEQAMKEIGQKETRKMTSRPSSARTAGGRKKRA